MSPKELLVIALRVLADWNRKREPKPDDVQILRFSADPLDDGLRLDQLACSVVQRVIGNQRIIEQAGH